MADRQNQPDIDRINQSRVAIKAVAEGVEQLRKYRFAYGTVGLPSSAQAGEAIANVTLAYRHLEDASMRLGKALQALDGGVSVYDRSTTVGA